MTESTAIATDQFARAAKAAGDNLRLSILNIAALRLAILDATTPPP